MHKLLQLIAVSALIVTAGCAATGGSPTPSGEPSDDGGTAPSDAPGEDPTFPTGGIDEETIAALLAAAAAEANVDLDEIRVVTAEQVTWPNGAIGCPEPGMGYTEALVPGYRVVLEIDGEELNFHASEGGEFFFCDDPEPPVEG